jgi:hypothetical protein
MSHSKPTVAGTLFLALLIAPLALPGVVIVAHDVLPHRLPWVEPHPGGD